jgi:hypothetical protein
VGAYRDAKCAALAAFCIHYDFTGHLSIIA